MRSEIVAKGFGEANESFWLRSVPQVQKDVPVSDISECYDVAIIGAGLTGIWTAWYLHHQNPKLRIGLFEANHIAFGASGRNGGWVSGLLDNQAGLLADLSEPSKKELRRLIAGLVDEVGAVIAAQGIDCGYHKGGMLRIAARHSYALAELEKEKHDMSAECGDNVYQVLDAAQASAQVGMRNVMGGIFYPHCAVVNPAALAYGLATILRQKGVAIHENTIVRQAVPGRLETSRGSCSTGTIVIATEAYSSSLPGLGNRIVGAYSHIVTTDPLPPSLRKAIGLADRQAFADTSGAITYGQVTQDGRLVFGGTANYPFAGKPGGLSKRKMAQGQASAHKIMVDAFPALRDVGIAHAWSGPLGLARKWHPTVIAEPSNKIIFAGGYGGQGVGASNLFGRTVADLILGVDSQLVRAPWTLRDTTIKSGLAAWEPEPLRTLGANLSILPGIWKDRVARSGLPLLVKKPIIAALACVPKFK
ncbi:FAD-dependent oxidoreductase [Rhizobium sp. ARZ01]|uniref:NAD(P)/FAD-dependent oxidoreductase n=1 Tax=Rhizobium sp. ARZ01 TaxID=2769313 RepID=UPI00177CB99C|nr:FAD-dependent oxidoreductase [Rhizobium sp. ARZ01]MBD9375414.1 FAD-dependent oxidoreductase [Rhizobium sp. ARZ01]